MPTQLCYCAQLWFTLHLHRSAYVAVFSRGQHACTTASECLAKAAEEGGAEAGTATEGQHRCVACGGSLRYQNH